MRNDRRHNSFLTVCGLDIRHMDLTLVRDKPHLTFFFCEVSSNLLQMFLGMAESRFVTDTMTDG